MASSFEDTVSKLARKYREGKGDADEDAQGSEEEEAANLCNMQAVQMDRALFTDVFDKYFDESKEGDVDIEEFGSGLSKLGVELPAEQRQKLFSVLLKNGSGGSGGHEYIGLALCLPAHAHAQAADC